MVYGYADGGGVVRRWETLCTQPLPINTPHESNIQVPPTNSATHPMHKLVLRLDSK